MSSSIVEKLIAAHDDQQFVLATTRHDVLAVLDRIKGDVQQMEDFTQFPEGADGVILFALLKDRSRTCPDAGDFNQLYQGCQAALSTAFKVLEREIDWFPGAKPSGD
jgi:hypothetical protein